MTPPSIFFDADAIFAAVASPRPDGASRVLLSLGEIGLLTCVTSEQAVTEVERNLGEKLPARLPELRRIIGRCLTVVPDPDPAVLHTYRGLADPKDLSILVAAIERRCSFLLTFNLRHYSPPPSVIAVERPGAFLARVRLLLSTLSAGAGHAG
jgi:hypothetical protein